jgi:hypothetical protein
MPYGEKHKVVYKLSALERHDVGDVIVVDDQLSQVLVRRVVSHRLQRRNLYKI